MKAVKYKLLLAITAILLFEMIGNGHLRAQESDDGQFVSGRVVAVGISGVSAISPVGTFLPGGPIHDKPALAAFTEPGRVLDPARILVSAPQTLARPWPAPINCPVRFSLSIREVLTSSWFRRSSLRPAAKRRCWEDVCRCSAHRTLPF